MENRLKQIKNELIYLIISFIVMIIIFKIAFINEGIAIILRTVSSLYFMFIVPGFALLYYWNDKLSFIERFVLSLAVSGAIIGIVSYYLGLAGLHIKYTIIHLPALIIIIAVLINWKRSQK